MMELESPNFSTPKEFMEQVTTSKKHNRHNVPLGKSRPTTPPVILPKWMTQL